MGSHIYPGGVGGGRERKVQSGDEEEEREGEWDGGDGESAIKKTTATTFQKPGSRYEKKSCFEARESLVSRKAVGEATDQPTQRDGC